MAAACSDAPSARDWLAEDTWLEAEMDACILQVNRGHTLIMGDDVDEGQVLSFTVTLAPASEQEITVDYVTIDGSAASGAVSSS